MATRSSSPRSRSDASSLIKKLQGGDRTRTTFAITVMQSRAYRLLKKEIARVLRPHKITTLEWAFLGLIYDAKRIAPSVVARAIGVKAPFVTGMIARLKKLGYITEILEKDDARMKAIILTESGHRFVQSTELEVRESLLHVVDGVSAAEFSGYLSVLQKIATNVAEQ